MSRSRASLWRWSLTVAAASAIAPVSVAVAQAAQKKDAEYTALIKQRLSDPRISTELVDHLPALGNGADAAEVPRPHRRRTGHPRPARGHSPLPRAIAKAAPKRAKYWTIGKTEEGRDMIVLAIGNEATHHEPRQVQRLSRTR